MRFEFIKEHQEEFEVNVMCDVLEVSRSGFYAWCERPASDRTLANEALLIEIKRVFAENRCLYGPLRVWKALKEQEIPCSKGRVERLMRENGIRVQPKKRYTVTTQADESKIPAPNLLDRDFSAERPNRKWVADITYIWTQEGWLYLAGVMDLFSRRIVGWAMAEHMTAQLVCDAFDMAIQQRKPDEGLLHHSDRGSQYTSHLFQDRLHSVKAIASMSRKGNCYDNAAMESFFGTLKSELVDRTTYRTRAEAQTDVFFYIEGFYNRTRLHSYLGYKSPQSFEENYLQQQQLDLLMCPLISG